MANVVYREDSKSTCIDICNITVGLLNDVKVLQSSNMIVLAY